MQKEYKVNKKKQIYLKLTSFIKNNSYDAPYSYLDGNKKGTQKYSHTNDEVDLVTALKSYKKDNPQYFGDTVIKKTQTSPSLNAGGDKPQTTNDIMNSILRGNNQD